jgi:CRISPR-associated protein Csm5
MMQITVKTVTPVCIRSGETLSPLLDFVIAGHQVHFIDKRKLQDIFREDEPILRDFTRMALRGEGNIGVFLKEHALRLEDFISFSLPLRASQLERRSRQLHLPILSSQGAYLPGSSLKGVLRSALLFFYLQKKGRGAIEVALRRGGVYTGENIFRNDAFNISQDALRFVQVSDSSFVPVEKLAVYELKRLTSRGSIPLLILAIPLQIEFSFSLRVNPEFRRADIPAFWKDFFAGGERAILEALRSYTGTILEREIQILQKLKPYERLHNFYRKVQPVLQERTLFRLGFGKTYFFNSVGCFLSDAELREIVRENKRVRIGASFPATRFVIQQGSGEQMPLGWLVISKTQT